MRFRWAVVIVQRGFGMAGKEFAQPGCHLQLLARRYDFAQRRRRHLLGRRSVSELLQRHEGQEDAGDFFPRDEVPQLART